MKDIYIKTNNPDEEEDAHYLIGWIAQCAMKYVICRNSGVFTDEYDDKDNWLEDLKDATESLLDYRCNEPPKPDHVRKGSSSQQGTLQSDVEYDDEGHAED